MLVEINEKHYNVIKHYVDQYLEGACQDIKKDPTPDNFSKIVKAAKMYRMLSRKVKFVVYGGCKDAASFEDQCSKIQIEDMLC